MTPEQLFLSHLDLIDGVIRFTCRRHRICASDCDDFASVVRLKLLENDYAVLRQFEHRSSLRTFLTVVVQNVYLDFRNSAWGKWRPSAVARRLGPLATQLEVLTVRNGLSFEDAWEALSARHGATVSREQLLEIALRLPRRHARQFVAMDAAGDVASPDPNPEARAIVDERDRRREALQRSVVKALQRLSAEDRVIMKMAYLDSRRIADIALALGRDQKQLYRHRDRLLTALRAMLEADGVGADDVREAFRDVEDDTDKDR